MQPFPLCEIRESGSLFEIGWQFEHPYTKLVSPLFETREACAVAAYRHDTLFLRDRLLKYRDRAAWLTKGTAHGKYRADLKTAIATISANLYALSRINIPHGDVYRLMDEIDATIRNAAPYPNTTDRQAWERLLNLSHRYLLRYPIAWNPHAQKVAA